MTYNGLFPIGTVVLLKDSTRRVMISGVAQYSISDANQRKLYDYVGVVFPEGFMGPEENLLFNADQIDKVFFIGLQDSESLSFLDRANQILEKLRAEQ